MNTSKRGDHLFAAGLLKAIRDVADMMIRSKIGDTSEGRVLHASVASLQRSLTGGAFDTTVNRGRIVTGSDPHSVAFGRASRDFTQSMSSLVFVLEHRRDLGSEKDQAKRNELVMQAAKLVTDAKLYAELAVKRMFDAAIDPAVLKQITQGAGDKPRDTEIANARSALQQVRGAILAGIGKM
ncbi:hypothetical protein ACS0X5_16760 [Burkholderia gladioli]|uniref:hypothetical protein n=1 Tax=Burkholderia gladioli TaxID=28095 RepID=UPI003B9860CD